MPSMEKYQDGIKIGENESPYINCQNCGEKKRRRQLKFKNRKLLCLKCRGGN